MTTREPTPRRTVRFDLGAPLRLLAGVQQTALDNVPTERARYTSMGGVVLGTAAIATIAMGVAMSVIFGTWASPAPIMFTLLWGLFVLNLDRWLMSSIVDRDGGAWVIGFLPRIVLAVAFGVVIAEPLLLGVYDSAIVRHVNEGRQHEVDQVESRLVRCNPVLGSRPTDCAADHVLSVDLSPNVTQARLDELSQQAAELSTTVKRNKEYIDQLEEKQRRECAGEPGPGLSGQPGYGPRCDDAGRRVDEYKRDNQTRESVQKLAQLENAIRGLSAELQTERADYASKISAKIQERVAETRNRHQTIGLMERFRAMDELVSSNGYVRVTQWALRIFFILVDLLPVLVKLLSGRTAYDRVAAARRDREQRGQELIERTLAYRDTVRSGVERYRIDLDAAAARDRASVEVDWINSGTGERLQLLVDDMTDRILSQASGFGREVQPHRSPGELGSVHGNDRIP